MRNYFLKMNIRVFILVASLFVMRVVVLACGPYHTYDTYDSIRYSREFHLYIANGSNGTESGDFNTKWDFFDEKGGLQATFGGHWSYPEEGQPSKSVGISYLSPEADSQFVQKLEVVEKNARDSKDSADGGEIGKGVRLIVENAFGTVELKALNPCPVKAVETGTNQYAVRIYDKKTQQNLPIENYSLEPGFLISIERCYENALNNQLAVIVNHGEPGEYWNHYVDKIFILNPNNLVYIQENIYGFRAYKEHNYEKAVNHFKASLQNNPRYYHANFNMACTLALMGKSFKIGEPYLDAILSQPELTKKYITKIDTDKDLESWRKTPEYAEWLNGLKKNLAEKEQREREVKSAQRKKAEEFNRGGMAAYNQKNYEEAVKNFKQALAEDSSYVVARINLASIYALTGETDASVGELQAAKKINPDLTKKRMEQDHDFDPIRLTDQFDKIFKPE